MFRCKKKEPMADDVVEAIAAIALVLISVTGVVFWLSSHPY